MEAAGGDQGELNAMQAITTVKRRIKGILPLTLSLCLGAAAAPAALAQTAAPIT